MPTPARRPRRQVVHKRVLPYRREHPVHAVAVARDEVHVAPRHKGQFQFPRDRKYLPQRLLRKRRRQLRVEPLDPPRRLLQERHIRRQRREPVIVFFRRRREVKRPVELPCRDQRAEVRVAPLISRDKYRPPRGRVRGAVCPLRARDYLRADKGLKRAAFAAL